MPNSQIGREKETKREREKHPGLEGVSNDTLWLEALAFVFPDGFSSRAVPTPVTAPESMELSTT